MISLMIVFVIGGIIGYGIAKIWSADRPVGTIRIDSSDPDGPYLFLELESAVQIERLKHQKVAMVNVKNENYISQK